MIVECAGDICEKVAEHTGTPLPNSLYESFGRASLAGAFTSDVAQGLAEWVKLHNRLVHDYDRVDDAALYGSLPLIEANFSQFTKHVRDFLASQKAKGQ